MTVTAATYIKISASGIGRGFSAGDGVTISGCGKAACNGGALLTAVGDDYLVMAGVLAEVFSQTSPLTVRRTVPDMDFVTECGNRLWGCKYGLAEGVTVNEI